MCSVLLVVPVQLKTADNKVESMVYVSPSIDMNHFRNPSIRVYHLNSTTFELLDYDHYYFDLASATGFLLSPVIDFHHEFLSE